MIGVGRARGKCWSSAQLAQAPTLRHKDSQTTRLGMSRDLSDLAAALCSSAHKVPQHHPLPLYPSPAVVPEEIVLELQFVAALNLRAVRK